MPNIVMQDAPKLTNTRSAATQKYGDKQFYQLPQNLMSIIMNELSGKEGNQLKLMILLIGSIDTSAKGSKSFKIPESLIIQRCGMAGSRYREARKALITRGWIKHTPHKEIEILYDNIYAQTENRNNAPPIDEATSKITKVNPVVSDDALAARAKIIGCSLDEYKIILQIRESAEKGAPFVF